MLDALPNEIIYKVVRNLNVRDVCYLAMTCRCLCDAVSYDKIWRRFVDKHFIRREKINDDVHRFLHEFGERCSWKTCYRYLLKAQNFRPAFFWDDSHDLRVTKEPDQHLNQLVGLSKLTLDLVHAFLDIKSRKDADKQNANYDEEEVWRTTKKQIQSLSVLHGTINDYSLPKLIKVLLQVGTGPYKLSASTPYQPITTVNINWFYQIRYKEELLRYRKCVLNTTEYRAEYEKFIKHALQKRFQSDSCYAIFEDATKEQTESAVLRVLVSMLKHIHISSVIISKISLLVENSFKSSRWSLQSETSRKWVLGLLKSLSENNNNERYKETEETRRTVRKHLLDASVQDRIVALELTYRDQMNLMSYKLNEYIDCFLLDKKRQEDEMFRFLDMLDNEKLEVHRLQQLQEMHLPMCIVKHFEQTFIVNKSKKIQRLLDICECLYELNNFFSLKNILQGVRGVLSFKSRTNLTWGDIGFTYMKKFVRLERSVSAADDYKVYTDEINQTDAHCIPLLVVHLKQIQQTLKIMSKVSSNNQQKPLPDGCWYYIRPIATVWALEKIGALYYYFVQT